MCWELLRVYHAGLIGFAEVELPGFRDAGNWLGWRAFLVLFVFVFVFFCVVSEEGCDVCW